MAAVSFWPLWFLMRNLLSFTLFSLIGDVSFLFSVFKISSLSSAFWSLIMNYLGVNFFEFIVFGVQLATWIWSLSFAKFWKVSNIIYGNIFSSIFFLFSFCNSDDPNISSFVKVLEFPEVLFIFQKRYFLFIVQIR